jgi:hypothetical protein
MYANIRFDVFLPSAEVLDRKIELEKGKIAICTPNSDLLNKIDWLHYGY